MSTNGLLTEPFGKATVFESGYVHGFQQFEVQRIRFERGAGSLGMMAIFVRRGRRKEERQSAARVVVIDGWERPALETHIVERSPGAVVRHARYPAFSPEWDALLNNYLDTLGESVRLICDGRTLESGSRLATAEPRPRQVEPVELAVHDEAPSSFAEGEPEELLLTRFERDPAARRACLDHYGTSCQVCGLNMGHAYGRLGEGFVHVHHRVPLSAIAESYQVDPIKDLIPVCPNCHSMLHRAPVVLEVEALREMVEAQRRRD